jgi:hypothetical protein
LHFFFLNEEMCGIKYPKRVSRYSCLGRCGALVEIVGIERHMDRIGLTGCAWLYSVLYLCTFHSTIRDSSLTDFRRLARRGGVKRIAGTIYDDVRKALKDRLQSVRLCCS